MGFANKISLSRILAIPFFVTSLFYYTASRPYMKWVCVGIFFFSMLTDIIDGFIARLKKQKTELGKVLDPLADKLFLMNSFIWIYHLRNSLPVVNKLPLLVLIIVLSRDLIIMLGVLVFFLFKIEVKIEPNVWGKLTTFFQMMTVLFILLSLSWAEVVWITACVFTVVSGILYFKRGVAVLNALDKNLSGNNNR